MDRLEKLRAGREIPQVVLQKYNQLRTKFPGTLVCAFEGADDVTFYDTVFTRVRGELRYVPFVCKGKDQVLSLRTMLERNVSTDAQLVRYFVDNDFDGLKGHLPSEDIYCTPCYSIENALVNDRILIGLLRSEFRCNDEYGDGDIRKSLDIFKDRLTEFQQAIESANKLIFYARRSLTMLSDIEEDLSKYVKITLREVSSIANEDELCRLVGFKVPPDSSELTTADVAFKKLNAGDDWRGKFIFGFFKKFLSELKEDRGRKNPEIFAKRGKMTFSPGHDIIRTLSVLMSVPKCLEEFVCKLPDA